MSLLRADQSPATDSYYAATTPQAQDFPTLEGRIDCDIAVVGGGLAGLSAAIELADMGFDVVLLDARTVGSGASGRNGGQALAGLACEHSVIEAQLGATDARAVGDMTLEAIALIHARCERFGVDCEWQAGYLSLAVNERKGRELAQWHAHMQRHYGYEATPIAPGKMSQWITSAVLHAVQHIKPRLWPRGVVANPRDTTRYRCGLRLATGPNPSVFLSASQYATLHQLALSQRLARPALRARIRHRPFPRGRLPRTPALVLGMAYYRLRDML